MSLDKFTKPLTGGVVALLLFVVIVLVVWGQQPPIPRSAKAPVTAFSAGRAMLHVKKIAVRPHPMWSAENVEVRNYLLRTLKVLGYKPMLHRAQLPKSGLHSRVRHLAGRVVTNVMVRIQGSDNKGLVAVVAHYDSTHHGPGAADDGAAVAGMLETLRALRHLPKPKNDLLFLFTDAEEIGLWGAKLFARHHPWARELKFVLNFEARGSRGPSLMFETPGSNGKTIAAFAKADHAPRATSLFYEVYRFLPNNTDFTVFKKLGVQGLNFAFLESIRDYHKPTDTALRLSPASLQDHGEHMLSMVRYLSQSDLSQTQAPNVVYFDVLGRFLIVYGETTSLVLSLLLVLLVLAGFGYAWRQGLVLWWRVGLGMLYFLLVAGGVGLVVGWFAVKIVKWRGRQLYGFYWDITNDGLYIIAFSCLAACLFFLLLGPMTRLFQRLERAFSALLIWAVLLLLSVFYVPGASYLAMWPLAGATCTCLLVIRQHKDPASLHFVSFRLWLLELPLLLVAVPLFYHLPYAITLTITGLTSGLLVLFASLLFVSQDALSRVGYRWPALGFFLSFTVFFLIAQVL